MKQKVGIPRGMFYYDYYLLWKEFFNNLNIEVVTSPKTNKEMLNKGVHACVDEACLPVKIFHGHVDYLKDKVDYIFIPKFISIYEREYCCPKHLGLPDMVKHSIEGLPQIIDTEVNLRKSNKSLKKSILYTGKYFTRSSKTIYRAFNKAYNQFYKYVELMSHGIIPLNAVGLYEDLSFDIKKNTDIFKRQILLLGHSYNIYDDYINMNIAANSKLPKRMFWSHGQKIVGAAFSLIERKAVHGIIYISAFGCGLDSVLIDLVERKAKESKIPFTLLTIDEQTGEAGINTRIEAFIDMLEWRDKDEDNFSTYG